MVEVPLDVPAANVEPLRLETTVTAVYRTGAGGKWSDDFVGVIAYIPPHSRRCISPLLYSAWIGKDYMRCLARVKDNKRSLRPFMASNDARMELEA
ncbi:hypothetical protein [Paraburkholderia sp. J8-2]|uniref:hypothetical protein n=1 Tax=Paraburkholderia sp. J8-2 TaxID=2805440 RepID=UPI002AB6A73F|nr:hypothetical protein [Paraburkholderia sp. J8-2]